MGRKPRPGSGSVEKRDLRRLEVYDLLADPEFRRGFEEEDQRRWESFKLRLLAWDGESEELPDQP